MRKWKAWGVFRGRRLLNHLYLKKADALIDRPLAEDEVRQVEIRETKGSSK